MESGLERRRLSCRPLRSTRRWLLVAGAIALSACTHENVTASGGSPMSNGLLEVRNISVSILRSPQDVYAFASNGENLPRWASGLGHSVRSVNGEWVVEGPLGRIGVRFAAPNGLGVLDHDVVLPSGTTVHNPMRVVPNGTGSTVTFTLMRLPGVSEAKFTDDAKWVERDLTTLKRLLEQAPREGRTSSQPGEGP
jgi:hypothetical protein